MCPNPLNRQFEAKTLLATPQSSYGFLSGEWRPFGSAEDLNLNFATDDRPALVTTVLASCSELRDSEYWWSQLVSTRIVGLMRLIAATDKIDHLTLLARCREVSCAEPFEFKLPLAIMNDAVPGGETFQVALGSNRSVSLRFPNGQDLFNWRRQKLDSRQAAITTMLKSLVVEGQPMPEDEPVLAEALSTLDPLVAFAVSCSCPACGSPNEIAVDLEYLALTRLKQQQCALFHQIHRLASNYGWNETEVLAVSPARRAQYLAMIEDER